MSKILQYISHLPFIAANYHFPGQLPAHIWLTMVLSSIAPAIHLGDFHFQMEEPSNVPASQFLTSSPPKSLFSEDTHASVLLYTTSKISFSNSSLL